MRILNLSSLLLPSQDSSSPCPPSLNTPLPTPGESTLIAEGSRESREALADATDVVAGPAAVHAEGTRLGAAMAIEPGGTDWG